MIVLGAVAAVMVVVAAVCASAWYRQFLLNGRHLLRIEALEAQLNQVVSDRDTAHAMHNSQFGLPHGSVLNDFELDRLGGGTMTRTEWRGTPHMLVFVNPDDDFSVSTLRDLARFHFDGQAGRPLAIALSSGTEEQNRALLREAGIDLPVLLQEDWEAANLMQVSSTPSAYFVTADDVTAGELAVGQRAVLELAETVAAGGLPDPESQRDRTPLPVPQLHPGSGPAVGSPAPAFDLPTVDGQHLTSADLRGPVLLVFSQPDCAPCDALAPELVTLSRDQSAPGVVMVGRGDPEANAAKARQFGFSFPVALQSDWELSRAYGVVATPSAYLIDADGRIASPLAVGMGPIMTLARTGEVPGAFPGPAVLGRS